MSASSSGVVAPISSDPSMTGTLGDHGAQGTSATGGTHIIINSHAAASPAEAQQLSQGSQGAMGPSATDMQRQASRMQQLEGALKQATSDYQLLLQGGLGGGRD